MSFFCNFKEIDSLVDILNVPFVECVHFNFCGFRVGACDVWASVEDP